MGNCSNTANDKRREREKERIQNQQNLQNGNGLNTENNTQNQMINNQKYDDILFHSHLILI